MKRMQRSIKLTFAFCLGLLNLNYAFCDTLIDNKGEVGTTFSQVQCEYLNLDWKEIYKKTLEIKFDILRLSAYWNRIEKEEGVYDFRELDWQLREAKRDRQKIILTVGMKAPRWPEFHMPGWLLIGLNVRSGRDIAEQPIIREKTLQLIEAVVSRYKESPEIAAWQVENEPLDRSGPNDWRISQDFLEQEVALVKMVDTKKRPIILTSATYPNRFLRILSRLRYIRNPMYQIIDLAEIPALNIYSSIGHDIANIKICFFSKPPEYKKYFGDIIAYAKSRHKELWVSELQAEPWEPGQLVHLEEKESITCSPENYAETFKDIRLLGINVVLLWGVEYWFYRKEVHNDYSWLKEAREILKAF